METEQRKPIERPNTRTNYTITASMKAQIVQETQTGGFAREAECVRTLLREALDARAAKRRA